VHIPGPMPSPGCMLCFAVAEDFALELLSETVFHGNKTVRF
jgi:hypothetical protein